MSIRACRLPCCSRSAQDIALPSHPEWQSIFDTYGVLPRHMSQLYELALEGVVLFIILNLYIRKPRPMGQSLVCS
ncbi:MAG: hypothetical protein ACLTXH_02140 [Enterobacter hormaechei]